MQVRGIQPLRLNGSAWYRSRNVARARSRPNLHLVQLALVAPLLAGCQDPPDSGSSSTSKPAGGQAQVEADDEAVEADDGAAAPADTCSAEAMKAEFEDYCAYDIGVPPIELPKVAWTGPSYHPLTTRVISLTTNGLTDPEGEGTVPVEAWLADPPRSIADSGQMVFAVAADVPAKVVAELQREIAAKGRQEVRYLVHVASEEPVPQPRRADLLEKMKAKTHNDPNAQLALVAEGVRRYAEDCPAFGEGFGALANEAPEARCGTLASFASESIVACGCREQDEIATMIYALTVGFDLPKGRAAAVPVNLDPTREYAIAEGQTWGEVASEAFTDGQLHRLWFVP